LANDRRHAAGRKRAVAVAEIDADLLRVEVPDEDVRGAITVEISDCREKVVVDGHRLVELGKGAVAVAEEYSPNRCRCAGFIVDDDVRVSVAIEITGRDAA